MRKLVLVFNIVLLSIGSCGGPLISRLYFIHGGQRIWISAWLQTVGCPVILIPLGFAYFRRRKLEGPDTRIFFITRQEFNKAAGVGLIAGVQGYLTSWGPAKLPVSTSTLINATQLAFNALFAVLLVKQKITKYSMISIALLITGAAILALRVNGDRPAGESAEEYMLGFVMNFIGAVLYGLLFPLVEMVFVKAKQAATYISFLESQMIIGTFATAFCSIGMIINKDFQAIPREAMGYEIGEMKYYWVLICCAILWQFSFFGLVGVIFYSSALLSGIVNALSLPLTQVLAVMLLHERFQAEKGVAVFLALLGFLSYFYGENEQVKKPMNDEIRESQVFLLHV